MITAGAGIYFDGRTSERHPVEVELEPTRIVLRHATERQILARWPISAITQLHAPTGRARFGLDGQQDVLARLEVRDPQFADAFLAWRESHAKGKRPRRGRARVVAWTIAAAASLVITAVYAVPAIAERLAPHVPLALEHRLGAAVEAQTRAMLDTGPPGRPFECGTASGDRVPRAALDRLIARLESTAALPIPLRVVVVRRAEPNAVALPGGHIYLYEGLIGKTETPDELAGVLAHEIGHVAHRDGTRSVLQAAGLSLLFGMLLGDFVGGGAVVIAARALLNSAYTREVESVADRYSVELMKKVGGEARALGTFLQRVAGAIEPGGSILGDHPDTKGRVAAIEAAARSAVTPWPPPAPLLSPADWAAVKRICQER